VDWVEKKRRYLTRKVPQLNSLIIHKVRCYFEEYGRVQKERPIGLGIAAETAIMRADFDLSAFELLQEITDVRRYTEVS
jgi:hypothetical protein